MKNPDLKIISPILDLPTHAWTTAKGRELECVWGTRKYTYSNKDGWHTINIKLSSKATEVIAVPSKGVGVGECHNELENYFTKVRTILANRRNQHHSNKNVKLKLQPLVYSVEKSVVSYRSHGVHIRYLLFCNKWIIELEQDTYLSKELLAEWKTSHLREFDNLFDDPKSAMKFWVANRRKFYELFPAFGEIMGYFTSEEATEEVRKEKLDAHLNRSKGKPKNGKLSKT